MGLWTHKIHLEKEIMEEDQIVALWDIFLEFIPEKNREQAATQYVDFLMSQHIDIDILESLQGCDQYLDDAIEAEAKEYNDADEDAWDGEE